MTSIGGFREVFNLSIIKWKQTGLQGLIVNARLALVNLRGKPRPSADPIFFIFYILKHFNKGFLFNLPSALFYRHFILQ